MSEEKNDPQGDQEAKEVTPDNTNTPEQTPAQEASAESQSTDSQSGESPVAGESGEAPQEENPETPEEPQEEAQESEEIAQSDAVEAIADEAAEAQPEEAGTDSAEEETATPDQPEAATEETPAAREEENAPVAEAGTAETAATAETPEASTETTTAEDTDSTEPASEEPVAENTETTDQTEPAAEQPVASTTEEGTTTAEAPTDENVAAATDEEQEEVAEEELIDYSNHTREELAEVVDELSKQDNFKRSDAILSKVLPLFKAMARARRQEALDKFLEEGGEKDDFEYRHDEVFNRFDASVRLIRDRRASYYKEREARKEANYQKKLEILDKLRELIDGENATTNLSPIKALQEEWKALGPVPAQHNRTLWANYNALLDRFYNNRHILFELKELDRKKNLVKKTELCEKAEALDKLENIKDAIVQLNELHVEYKKIGAVPREVQEELWQRFKAASDAIYKKRKTYLEGLKGELNENLKKKRALAEELKPYLDFDSDRINDWNAKTKEILAIQKKWDALGGLPREHAKEVNKAFWSAFKGFFSRKNAFFKKLEGMRHENLQKKEELVAQAEALKDNDDWDKTSEALKKLQRQWKEIGPVPEKFRNSVYAKFKEACDAFFNNRRASQNKAEAQFVENLKHKEDLVAEILERAKAGDGAPGELDDIMVRWSAIGFVPRSSIKTIEEKFAKAIDAFVQSLDVADDEREALVMKAELSSLKKGPNSDRRLNKKESTLRKQIQELEDNINLWNNNLAFFANSKTADKLKAEFDEKIAKAEEEVAHLKKQLRMVRSM